MGILGNRRRAAVLAVSLALGLSAGLGIALALPFVNLDGPEQRTSLREVDVAQLAAPPPPPQAIEAPTEELIIAVTGVGAEIMSLQAPPLQVAEFDAPSDVIGTVSEVNIQMPDIELSAFSLSELDTVPRLLTEPRIQAPAELQRRLSGQHRVRLEVQIDEQGHAELLEIVESPHPDLAHSLARMVQRARFTAPMRDGKAVAARFIWPLDIEI